MSCLKMCRKVCTEVALFDVFQYFVVMLFLENRDLGQRVRPTKSWSTQNGQLRIGTKML